jgi:hypothetical protein
MPLLVRPTCKLSAMWKITNISTINVSTINASNINAFITNISTINASIINASNASFIAASIDNMIVTTVNGQLYGNINTNMSFGTIFIGSSVKTNQITTYTGTTIDFYGTTYNFRSGTAASPGDLATINTGTFNSTSDVRVKNIIRYITIDESRDFINNTNPILFNWKNDRTQRLISGYIAQEVIKTADHLVYTSENNEMKESTDGPEGKQYVLNYDGIIPYHGVAIKHLLQENIELKKEVKELSKKIDILTTKFDLLNN